MLKRPRGKRVPDAALRLENDLLLAHLDLMTLELDLWQSTLLRELAALAVPEPPRRRGRPRRRPPAEASVAGTSDEMSLPMSAPAALLLGQSMNPVATALEGDGVIAEVMIDEEYCTNETLSRYAVIAFDCEDVPFEPAQLMRRLADLAAPRPVVIVVGSPDRCGALDPKIVSLVLRGPLSPPLLSQLIVACLRRLPSVRSGLRSGTSVTC